MPLNVFFRRSAVIVENFSQNFDPGFCGHSELEGELGGVHFPIFFKFHQKSEYLVQNYTIYGRMFDKNLMVEKNFNEPVQVPSTKFNLSHMTMPAVRVKVRTVEFRIKLVNVRKKDKPLVGFNRKLFNLGTPYPTKFV